jgi:transposase InsO family protein
MPETEVSALLWQACPDSPCKFPQRGEGRRDSDGTEIPTDEGKLHLVSVMDAASRRILGFTLSERHDAAAAYGALAMAVTVRGGTAPGVIMHTDQGSEPRFKGSSQHCLAGSSIGIHRGPLPGSSSGGSCGGGC